MSLTANQVVSFIEAKYNTKLHKLTGKRIFYCNKHFCVCSPESKFHESVNAYWVDITEKQKQTLNMFDTALLVFRLDSKICEINWKDLSPLLDYNSMQHNTNEGNHWKLYIYNTYIQIRFSQNKLTCSHSKID